MLVFFHRCLCCALLLSLSSVVYALKLNPHFFPDDPSHSEESIYLHGLAQLYPGTVVFKDPKLEPRSLRENAAQIETLPSDITYVRIYRLEEAMAAIHGVIDQPALILDLRYLQSESSGAGLAKLLNSDQNIASVTGVGIIPSEITASINDLDVSATRRKYPAIVLCNRETAGPFETILDALQSDNCIVAVGEATAGRTGFYTKHESDDVWIIQGELRPSTDKTLIENGFVPRIKMDATPETNYLSYNLYETGRSITRLLRKNANALPTTETGNSGPNDDEPFEPDAVLQRGVDIVAALQILQQLPKNDEHGY